MKTDIKFIELFAGIGGFRYGLEKSNRQHQEGTEIGGCGDSVGIEEQQSNQPQKRRNYFSCVWSNDNDKYACQIYRKKFGNKENRECESEQKGAIRRGGRPIGDIPSTTSRRQEPKQEQRHRVRSQCKDSHWDERSRLYEGDIRAIDPSVIPEHDLLTAGFPCQSFSIAGQRGGFTDIRGTLFFEICRILRAKRTPYLLLENVKGLLSAPYTKSIQEWVEADFDEFTGEPTAKALKKHKAIPGTKGWVFLTILNSLWELGYGIQWMVLNSKNYGVPQNRERVFIIGHLRGQSRPKVFPIGETNTVYTEADGAISHAIDSNYHKGWLDNQQRTMIYDIYNQGLRANQDLAGALKGEGIADTSLGTALIMRDGRDNRSCLREGRTLELDIKGQSIRRLTPLECERLQGFPDGWTEGISDTQRYKCLGNAVTTNVIEAIGRQMLLELKV